MTGHAPGPLEYVGSYAAQLATDQVGKEEYFLSRLGDLARSAAVANLPTFFRSRADRTMALTDSQVADFYDRYLTPELAHELLVRPLAAAPAALTAAAAPTAASAALPATGAKQKESASAGARRLDPAALPPEPDPRGWMKPLGLGHATRARLSNGMEVIVLPRPGSPFHSAVVAYHGGKGDERAPGAGVASLWARRSSARRPIRRTSSPGVFRARSSDRTRTATRRPSPSSAPADTPPAPPALERAAAAPGGRLIVQHRPGATDANLSFECVLPPSDPHTWAATWLFSSAVDTLFRDELRERIASSYGARSRVELERGGTTILTVTGDIDFARLPAALQVVRRFVEQDVGRTIDAGLFGRAQLAAARSYNLSYETTEDTALEIATLWNLGWPLETVDRLPDAFTEAKREDLLPMATRCKDNWVLGVLGDEAQIRASLQGWAP